MDEKRARLHQLLDEACDWGLGEFQIKIKEDGEFFVHDIRWKKNPAHLDCQEALENISTFGGIDTIDGEVKILRIIRKIKL